MGILTLTFDRPMLEGSNTGLGWTATKAGSTNWTSTGILDVSGATVRLTMSGSGIGTGAGTCAFDGTPGSTTDLSGNPPAAVSGFSCVFT